MQQKKKKKNIFQHHNTWHILDVNLPTISLALLNTMD